MSALLESVALVNQRVLNATVDDGHDDDKVVLDGPEGALSSTAGLDVKFPFAVSKGGIGQERLLQWAGVLAHVLLSLHHPFGIGQRRSNIVALVVEENRGEVS